LTFRGKVHIQVATCLIETAAHVQFHGSSSATNLSRFKNSWHWNLDVLVFAGPFGPANAPRCGNEASCDAE